MDVPRGRAPAGVAVLIAVICGCGADGSAPSTAEQRSAAARWVKQADALCTEAERKIAAHGRPASIDDLPDLIAAAAVDARQAVLALGRLRPPAHIAKAARALDEAADRLDPALAELEIAARDGRTTAVAAARDSLESEIDPFRTAAKEAGLKVCSRPAGQDEALAALEAVLFLDEMAVVDRRFARRSKPLRRASPSSRTEAIAFYDRYAAVLRKTRADWLMLEAPESAESEDLDYRLMLDDAQDLCAEIATELERRSDVTPEYADSVARRFDAVGRRERRALRRLQRAVRTAAEPLTPEPRDRSAPGASEPA